MKRASLLSLVWAYLREKAGLLLLLAACAGIVLAVASLSGLSLEPLGYALALCALMLALAGLFSWARFVRRFRQAEMGHNHPDLLSAGLPEPGSRMEALYQALLRKQGEAFRTERDHQERLTREREVYYTLWTHQIKTPLSALRLLMQSGQAPQGHWEEELFKVERYAQMALEYLRLSGQADDLKLREHDLYGLVKKAVKKYALLFIRQKITLELEPFELKALTDEKWFLVILEQLLSNAVKYASGGTVRIAPEGEDVLTVSDTGMGIPPEDLPMVFELGFTGSNGRMEQRATGIGLYLAREAARRLGHGLTIRSTPGKGTQVSIHISREPLRME